MSITAFIRANRKEIDRLVAQKSMAPKLNDYERQMWILNDENLYNWARSEGVKI